jgi:hypothetical protein
LRFPASLQRIQDPEVAVDATYFVIRTLRNALRGYGTTAVSPEISDPAFRIAEAAVREIAAAEGSDIGDLSAARITEYIELLGRHSQERYETAAGGSDSARGEELLTEMRHRNPT